MRLLKAFLFSVSTFCPLLIFAQNYDEAQLADDAKTAVNKQVDVSDYIQRESKFSTPQLNAQNEQPEGISIKPFGANLFESGLNSARSDGLNPDYVIVPGDKIAVQLWGATELANVFTVDNQGNIFIPQVGPIHVSGISASQLNNTVSQKVKAIYPNNVSIYVNLLSATPVNVYVTGPVLKPGQYAGLANESLLYYLKQAGGIDPLRGSYRRIFVKRNEQVVANFDLYQFLRAGNLAAFNFKDGDVILVGQQGATVTVEGAARYPLTFELTQQHSKGSDLIKFARPLSKTSHVAINGNRAEGPFSDYIPIADFDDFIISDGDTVLFNDDLRPQVISVKISGSYLGPSFYAVGKNTKLKELLDYVEVDPNLADVRSIYIKRESVAQQQKELLEMSLQRLERSVFTAPAASDGESRIRAQEAELVMKFVEHARQIKPLGKVVLSGNNDVANINLEQGDEIVIPQYSDLVQIAGEVLLPQAIVYDKNYSVLDYINWSGGYSERANTEKVAIIHANGLTTFVTINGGSGWFGSNNDYIIQPGDKILVIPRVDTKMLQAVKDITQIIYQIAVAANVAIK
ncbi:polysaccharide biosynthesis/export family protein [Neptunicella marina]|uniref:Polysaccharide biosynthesis/export family protein n=2 Tax=Neptunicella marina TaxID=2125989 RepID=A0A8J6ISB7_9ALTE|nr:polysaccharide biosynthesis/export family protein [Neptunicella marina]